jgi:hypothetical protein
MLYYLGKNTPEMDQLLHDYKAYYAARARRYQNNPVFYRTAVAEGKLSDAMQVCAVLEEFKDRMGTLNEECATAVLLDSNEYQARVYLELDEVVRAQGPKDIVEKCAGSTNSTELIRQASEILLNNSKDISADLGTVAYLKGFLQSLERIQIVETVQFHPLYHADVVKAAARMREELKKQMLDSREQYRKFHPDFDFDWNALWEPRHRRVIPIPDDVLARRIETCKTLLNS